MRLSRLQRLLASASLILFTTCGVATGSRHETFAEFLKRHNIELTEAGLVAALKNPDPEVRDNAAAELAGEKVLTAIPAMKEAFAAEKDPGMQVNIAYAIAQMGDKDGSVALKRLCDTAPASPRLKAALYMLRLNDESCLDAVMSILRAEPGGDHAHVEAALSLVSSFHNLEPLDEQRLIALTVKLLADPSPSVRMTASQALEQVGDTDVVPSLKKAIADETDQVARSFMQAELQKLKARE